LLSAAQQYPSQRPIARAAGIPAAQRPPARAIAVRAQGCVHRNGAPRRAVAGGEAAATRPPVVGTLPAFRLATGD